MAQHRATGEARQSPRRNPNPPRHSELTAQGMSREAISALALVGSSIPKGPLSPALGAQHASDSGTLTTDQTFAQVAIAQVLAVLDARSSGRGFRADARMTEATTPTAEPAGVDAPRLRSFGQGPVVYSMGMVEGDLARTVSEFARFGYRINRAFDPARLDAMTHYTYWQTRGAAIVGPTPQRHRETIAAAFDQGVTIWNDLSEIGTDVSSQNTPVSGISY